jgi:type II secretory pathway component GspD/PulD (secretin)/tetratricopeptide (TPR) repeat protein
MQYHTRSVRSLVAAAGLVAAVYAAPALAQGPERAASDAPSNIGSAAATLDRAAELMAEGRFVQAKGLVTALTRDGGLSLSDTERTRALSILNNANRRIKSLSPVELSLQTAVDSIDRGELRAAERQLSAVMSSPQATRAQMNEATELMDQIRARRAELEPQVPGLIVQAKTDFDAGRYAEAKATLDLLHRSGVALTEVQEDTLIAYQTRIVDLENKQGSLFRTNAGMLAQPGVVRTREPQPEPAPEAPAPQAQAQPEPAPAPAPAEAAPAPAPAPQPEQPEDPIYRARRLEAQAILAEAHAAFDQARYNEAVSKFDRALTTYASFLTEEEANAARLRVAEARTRLDQGTPTDLTQLAQQNKLRHDAALAMYLNDMERARRALSQGDTEGAVDLVASARLHLNGNREYFSQTEYDRLLADADTLRSEIDRATARRIQEEIERTTAELEREAIRQREAARRDKETKINEAIARVRALQREMNYDEALQVVDQILFLDPVNPTGLILRDILTDTRNYRRYYEIERSKGYSYQHHELENQDALIAPERLLGYPSDWPKIVYHRGEPAAFADAEENRRVLAVLQSKRIPANFNENPLSAVMAYIEQVANVNMDVDWAALETKGIERDTPVTLKLTNVTIETVLDRIMEKVSPDSMSGAAWAVQNGVLTVSSREAINKNKVLAIYDIRDLLVEVPDYENAPEFDLQSVLQSTGQGGGNSQSPFREAQQERPPRRTLEERTRDIVDIIQTNVDTMGWQANGGDVGAIQELSGSLIITNTPANHRAIQGLLRKLREVRSMQINVETRFLLVSQDFFEQIGFDIDLYFNANNNQVRAARAQNPNAQASSFFDFTQGGYQQGLFTPPGSSAANFAGQRPSPLSPIGVGSNSMGLVEGLAGGDFAGGILGSAPALGIAGQFLDDVQVDFLIKATQADRRTVSLTAPRLTFTNGQTSNIIVATQTAFVSDLQPVVSESAVGFDPTVNAVNEGVSLIVEGTISSDRRYVTLNVSAAVSKVGGFANTPVSAVAGGQLVNSAATQSFIQLPIITVTQVQTTVTVPDQGTILLGGQRLVTEQEVETGVPVLSKIPVLNRFFSNRITSKEEQTLLILLKPTILIQNEEEERNFPGSTQALTFGGQ